MNSHLIIRVVYEGTTYDLDVINEVPLRVDMSTVEVGEIGRLFGIGSQQFTLPGTKKNNRFFKNAYDIAADNPPGMYNSIDGYVIQNGETLLYGQFQLMEIVTDEDGFVNYNVQISDAVIQFNEEIKGKFLKDGNWSAYNHTLGSGSIVNSWSGNLLSGSVFYPLGEFGRDDENQGTSIYPHLGYIGGDIGNSLIPVKARQFLPAIKLKDTLDVIFNQVGFGYTGSFTETQDFNNLYLITKPSDQFGPLVPSASATFTAEQTTSQTVPLSATRYVTASTELTDPQNAYNPTTSQYTAQASGDHTYQASVTFVNNSFETPGPDGVNVGKVVLQLRAGDVGSYTVVATGEYIYDFEFDPNPITLTVTGTQNLTGGIDKLFAAVTYTQVFGPGTLPSLDITSATLAVTSAPTVYEGATIDMSLQFNPELKSEDVINGLITQFNLVMIPDANNPAIIQIETFDDWIRSGEYKDWNDKYDTSQRVSITHTINELPKSVILTNAEDNDRFSVISKEQEPYRQYGSLELIASSNNAIGDETLETVFAPVILGGSFQTGSNYPNIDTNSTTVFPHLYRYDNDKVKSYGFKPRLGYRVNNTLPSGSSIFVGLQGSLLQVTGSYGTLSNLSQLPGVAGSTNDLHFNNTYQDFGPILMNFDNGVTAFNRYWKTYYDSLYWDDAKKITLSAKFDPYEYKNIKLNDKILIKNQYYRINKIKGFNVSYRDVVEVELIRLYPAYFQFGIAPTPEPSPTPTPTATPTPSPTSTPTPTPTSTPTSTPTPTPTNCRTMDNTPYNFTYDASSGTTACTSGTPVTVYTTGNLPAIGVVLYTDTTGCTEVNQGYYSDGSVFFTVDQFGEITNSTNCVTPTPTPPTVYEVGDRTDTGSPTSGFACSDLCDTPLYASVNDFNLIGVGTTIYSNTGGTVLSGGDTWFGITATTGAPTKAIQINNSGVVTNDDVCAAPTPTPTPTPTPSPTPITYYEFENCDNLNLVYQESVAPGITVNDRYSDGVTNFVYTGNTTTLPGTVVTNLTYIGGTGCFDPTPTPTPTPQVLNAQIQNCGGSTVWYVTFTNLSSLPNGFAIESSHPNLTGQCWEIIDNNYGGAIDFSTTTTAEYSNCASCVPPTPTPTATPTPSPTPVVYSFSVAYSATSELEACAIGIANDTIYSTDSTLVQNSSVVYNESSLSTFAANGWYHDINTGNYYYVEGNGLVVEIGVCAAPSPTPTPTPSAVPCTGFDIQTTGSATSSAACSGASAGSRRRHNGAGVEPTTGDTVYSNIDCSTVFNGGNLWYYIPLDTAAIQINSSGLVVDKVLC